MNTANADKNGILSLSGSLDIYGVEETRQAILKQLQAAKELVLDLSGVEDCDAAGAQLLCAARKSAAQAGKACRFQAVSSALAEAWAGLGLSVDFFNHSHPDS